MVRANIRHYILDRGRYTKILETTMKKILFILTLSLLFCCSREKKLEPKQFTFYSSPSFYGGFKIELDNDTKKVVASLPYEYSLADSISPKTWKFIDSTDLASIQKFLPKESRFEIKPSKIEFEELEKCLSDLSQINVNNIPPCDGIGIYLETKTIENKTNKNDYYSPNESSKQGQLIVKIYNLLEKIFKDNSQLEYAIENSQRYFSHPILKIKSVNQLYVKFLDDDSDKLDAAISNLPASKTIFVDLTNFHKDKNELLEKSIRKKFSKIKWIVRNDENYGFAE